MGLTRCAEKKCPFQNRICTKEWHCTSYRLLLCNNLFRNGRRNFNANFLFAGINWFSFNFARSEVQIFVLDVNLINVRNLFAAVKFVSDMKQELQCQLFDFWLKRNGTELGMLPINKAYQTFDLPKKK
jgi:hypothetical protein